MYVYTWDIYMCVCVCVWDRTYILAQLRKWPRRQGCCREQALWPPVFWVVSNSPGSGFLKQDGNVGGRIWWEAAEGDLLPRRLCSRNQRRVWVFKLLLGSEWLLTGVFSSRTSLECLPRLLSEIAWLWALGPLLTATGPCLTLCCCCPVTKPCPARGDPVACSSPGLLALSVCPSLPRFMSTESVMPSNHLICSLLLPSVCLSIRVLSTKLALCIRCEY